MASSQAGAYFLFFYGISLQLFSVMIWVVFYKVPEKFGLLRKLISGPKMEIVDSLQIDTQDYDQQFLVQASPSTGSLASSDSSLSTHKSYTS
jgi:hypothetical protein